MSRTNTQIVLANRPPNDGAIDPKLGATFEKRSVPVPTQLPADSVLIEVKYVSCDPAMRGWLRDARSYLPPVQIGEVMRAAGLGIVVASSSPLFSVGDQVSATTGWQTYSVLPAKHVEKVPKREGAELVDALGVLGSSGMTAYAGMLWVAELKEGDVVVVTGAAGSVGSIAVQLAKLKGCTVIATAGSDDKVRWLKEELGADAAFNYKSPTFAADLKKCCQKEYKFVDVVFDNVGGEQLDLLLLCLRRYARIALCGAISDYNRAPAGLRNYQTLIAMEAKIQGFIVFTYASRYEEARQQLAQWISQGKLKRNFEFAEGGILGAPQALVDLFSGVNKGKMVVPL